MSYTDLRDFYPEYVLESDGYVFQIEKLGGGTIGRAYDGHWRYIVTGPDGAEIDRGQELHTGTPHPHSAIPGILADFLDIDIPERYDDE